MVFRSTSLALTILATLALTACNRAQEPMSPQAARTPEARSLVEGQVLGGFDLRLDLNAGTAGLLPERGSTAIGDTYSELGLAPAFTEMFGRNFEVTGLRQNGGDVEVDFRIAHPFSPAIRPDLAIFNLKAWAVSDRPAQTLGTAQVAPGLVTNAAGYGRMWEATASSFPVHDTASVQPYILLREDTESGAFDFQNPAGYNVFFPGMTSTATLALRLNNSSQIALRIYLTADYGQSAVRATRQTPAYELPQFAGNAAWKVAVTELTNDLASGATGSTASYQVDVWDWKHGAGLGSDVASASLEIPGVTLSPQTLALTGTGSDPTPLTVQTLVTNAAGAVGGDYWGIVTIIDEATSGVGLLENLTTPVSISSYVTYQIFPVAIDDVPLGDPPIAVITRACPGEAVTVGQIVSFDGAASIPGDTPIVDYEWDYDYDGNTFQSDATGPLVSIGFPSLGTRTVALRVRATDLQTDIATSLVTIVAGAAWGPPVRLTFTTTARELFDTSQNTSNSLAVGPDGRVHLAWFQQSPYEVWYQSFQPTPTPLSWDAPEMLFSAAGSALGHVSLQVDASGNPHVMYVVNAAGRPRQSKARVSGVWGAAMSVPGSANPGSWDRSLMVANAAGQMAYLGQWARGDQPASGSGLPALPNDMLFSTLNAGVWSPLTLIGGADVITSEGGGGRVPSHALVATSSGEWIAVWESLYTPFPGGPTGVPSVCKLKWSQTSGGTWPGAGTDLYADGTDYDLPILARSPNGRIWLGARIGTADAWGLGVYDGTTWSSTLTQIFAPTGVTFSRLPCAQFSFDAAGRGCLLVAYREPTAPVQAKFMHQDDTPATVAACTVRVIEPGMAGVGKPMCQIAAHGDGRFTAIWLTTKYNPGNPFFEPTEIEYATWE